MNIPVARDVNIPVDRDVNISVDRKINTFEGKRDTDKNNRDDENPVNDTHDVTFAATIQLTTTDGAHFEGCGGNVEIKGTANGHKETQAYHECLKTSENQDTENDNEVIDCSVSIVSKLVSYKFSATGLEEGTKYVENDTKVVKDETKDVEDETKCIKHETKCVEFETKCVEFETKIVINEIKCVDGDTKAVENETKDVENETKGVENVDEMDEDYVGCDMQTIDRPSLPGAED